LGLIRDNLDLGCSDRVSLIFERRVTKRTPGELYPRVIRKGVLPSIRIHYKQCPQAVLQRWAGLAHRDDDQQCAGLDLPRSLANFSTLVELGRRFNDRMLEQEWLGQDRFAPLDEMRRLGQSILLDNSQRASASRFGEPRVISLLGGMARKA
jgi:hypothetical protein